MNIILCYNIKPGNIHKRDKKKYRGKRNKRHTYDIIPSLWENQLKNSILSAKPHKLLKKKKGSSGKRRTEFPSGHILPWKKWEGNRAECH